MLKMLGPLHNDTLWFISYDLLKIQNLWSPELFPKSTSSVHACHQNVMWIQNVSCFKSENQKRNIWVSERGYMNKNLRNVRYLGPLPYPLPRPRMSWTVPLLQTSAYSCQNPLYLPCPLGLGIGKPACLIIRLLSKLYLMMRGANHSNICFKLFLDKNKLASLEAMYSSLELGPTDRVIGV